MNYWRTSGKAEVDFVLYPEKNQKPVPIEVKSRGKPGKGFLSFIKNYKPERALVFSEKGFGIEKMKGTDVAFVPHFFI